MSGFAERFYRALGKRMDSFRLELAGENINLLRLSRFDRGQSGALGFLFSGFEFRWGLNHKHKLVLKRRTVRKNYRASLVKFPAWIKANCRQRKDKLFAALNAKLCGYYNYYGVCGNFFYANEHEPKHVHVSKGDDYAKVELGSFRVSANFMNPKNLKNALEIIETHNQQFEAKWDEWQAKRQGRQV